MPGKNSFWLKNVNMCLFKNTISKLHSSIQFSAAHTVDISWIAGIPMLNTNPPNWSWKYLQTIQHWNYFTQIEGYLGNVWAPGTNICNESRQCLLQIVSSCSKKNYGNLSHHVIYRKFFVGSRHWNFQGQQINVFLDTISTAMKRSSKCFLRLTSLRHWNNERVKIKHQTPTPKPS